MNFIWSDLIDRFRVYADDDHNDRGGWLKPEVRMSLMQVEYRQLYRKWLRSGLINVEPVDLEFTGPSVTIPEGVLAIVGVAEAISTLSYENDTIQLGDYLTDSDTDGALNVVDIVIRAIGTGSVRQTVQFLNDSDLVTQHFTDGADAVFHVKNDFTTIADLLAWIATSTYIELVSNNTPSTVTALHGVEDGTIAFTFSGGQALCESWRPLPPLQSRYGRKPFRSNVDTRASAWSAFGAGDNMTIKLTPPDTQGIYVVRYIPAPENITDTTLSVELPYMGDERLVLGTAKRAGIKEGGRSGLIEAEIAAADAELAIEASAKDKEGGLLIRKLPRQSTPRTSFPLNPRDWTFI